MRNISPPIRAFFAIELSDSLRKIASQIIEELRSKPEYRKVRWVRTENIHITLRFLGNIHHIQVQEITTKLLQETTKIAPFEVECSAVTPFPSPSKAHIIAIEFLDITEMAKLAGAIERTINPLGFPQESRPFRPHITLGRIRHGHLNVIETNIDPKKAKLAVNEMVLFQSVSDDEGVIYNPLARFSLG